MRSVVSAVVFIAAAGTGAAQIQDPSFEVASIKPNKSGAMAPQRVSIAPGDRVTINNVTTRILIQVAHDVSAEQIVGGPGWLNADRFDILAKAESRTSTDQLRLMLRNLLAERFQFKAHTETRTTAVYALVLARSDGRLGPGLRPATHDCAALRANAPAGDNDPCGLGIVSSAGVTGRIAARGFELNTIIGIISRDAGRPIVNKTGLAGPFDADLAWTPRAFLSGSFNRDRFPNIDANGPTLSTALEEQWGLKLDSQKNAGEFLVIDSLERPTEN